MTEKLDDLEAVRRLVAVLESFGPGDQERIIRWAREKLGLSTEVPARLVATEPTENSPTETDRSAGPKDIKSFVSEKNPASDAQFAATVAHYYRFVAPPARRKEFITAEDLQEACRLVGRSRLPRPAQTLINAHQSGLLDKGTNRGQYVISTVGENLVAVSLPASALGRHARMPAVRSGKSDGPRAGRGPKRPRRE